MRARLIGALALVLVAIVTMSVLRRQPRALLEANEAVAVIPLIDGIRQGTSVVYTGGGGRVGHVESIERRQNELILRLRFDNDSGIVRRRGDAVSIVGVGGEKVVALGRRSTPDSSSRP